MCFYNSPGRLPFVKKPDYENGYRMIRPFMFKWREKIGKTECTCKNVIEVYQPFYRFYWNHEDSCALVVRLKNNPQLENLPCWAMLQPITYSD